MSREKSAAMPSDTSSELGFFDRFASSISNVVSRAPFFALAVGLVLLWLVEGVVLVIAKGSLGAFVSETYQLQINTLTTIVTFLLVALLQNTQTRADKATQEKLNATADALADLMEQVARDRDRDELRDDAKELTAAVGLEDVVSADDDGQERKG